MSNRLAKKNQVTFKNLKDKNLALEMVNKDLMYENERLINVLKGLQLELEITKNQLQAP